MIVSLLVALTTLLAPQSKPATDAKPDKLWVYLGTYTGKKSQGIYRCELEMATGKLSAPVLAGEAVNPSFLAIHPTGRFLYAVSEVAKFKGENAGAVLAFAIEPKTGNLLALNQESARGTGPCHLVLDAAGKHVLVANYGGGSVAALPVAADGKLGPATGFLQHQGSGANKQRQERPHAHSINLDAAGRFAFAADLGTDKVYVYRFDAAAGTLQPHTFTAASLKPGAGPRHFAFHPTGKYAYVINEMHCTMTAWAYDAQKGSLKELQTITTLPHEVKAGYSTAEVVAHPSGKFLYGSNRGHDSIVIYSVDPANGLLTLVGHEPTRGKTPRNFNLDPTGTYLLAANQGSDMVVVFKVDAATGKLTQVSQVEAPSPVCIKFLAVPR